MGRPVKPLRYHEPVIHGDTWTAVLDSPSREPRLLNEEGDPLDGIVQEELFKVVLNEERPEGSLPHTYHHEIAFHAVMAQFFTLEERCEFFRCTVEELDEREEKFIARFAPAQYDTLSRNGYLKYPKFPMRRKRKKAEAPTE